MCWCFYCFSNEMQVSRWLTLQVVAFDVVFEPLSALCVVLISYRQDMCVYCTVLHHHPPRQITPFFTLSFLFVFSLCTNKNETMRPGGLGGAKWSEGVALHRVGQVVPTLEPTAEMKTKITTPCRSEPPASISPQRGSAFHQSERQHCSFRHSAVKAPSILIAIAKKKASRKPWLLPIQNYNPGVERHRKLCLQKETFIKHWTKWVGFVGTLRVEELERLIPQCPVPSTLTKVLVGQTFFFFFFCTSHFYVQTHWQTFLLYFKSYYLMYVRLCFFQKITCGFLCLAQFC